MKNNQYMANIPRVPLSHVPFSYLEKFTGTQCISWGDLKWENLTYFIYADNFGTPRTNIQVVNWVLFICKAKTCNFFYTFDFVFNSEAIEGAFQILKKVDFF